MTTPSDAARTKTLAGKRLDTRARLVDAAQRVFQERGYETATVADIVEAAGASRANFYLYFTGKQDVYRAFGSSFVVHMTDRFARLDEIVADADRAALRAWIDDHITWSVQNQKTYAVWAEVEAKDPTVASQIWRDAIALWLDAMPRYKRQWSSRSKEPFARLGLFVGQLQFFHHSLFTPTERRITLDVLADAWMEQLRRPV